MNKEEVLIKNFIKNNPFDFKQGIISHCRHMDKLDIYEWVAEDELKIQQLQQENKELHNKIDKAIEYINSYDIALEDKCEYDYHLLEILKDSDVDE